MPDSRPEAPLLEVSSLTKRFTVSEGIGRRRVVRAVEAADLTVARGEVLALVGESGSGKTTIASLVARLLEPTAGTIRLHGKPVERSAQGVRAYRRSVQMVFQDPFAALNPVHTVLHHLVRPMLALGVVRTAAEAKVRAAALLETVGLTPPEEVMRKLPHQLSGGQRQRVVIARALAPEPELLLADEPTSMLDVSIRMGVMNLLLDLCATRGLGMLYITHDLAGARYVANRVAVMYAGRIVESGPADQVVGNPRHPYTRLLLSSVFTLERRGSALEAVAKAQENRVLPTVGCPFAPRCPSVTDACRQTEPPVFPVEPGHSVRCFLYGEAPTAPEVRA
jgi:peptide/nickel transport system ATP-binding protein